MPFPTVFFDSGGTLFDFRITDAGDDPLPDAVSGGGADRVATALGWLGYRVDPGVAEEELARLQMSGSWHEDRPVNEERLIAALMDRLGLPVKPEEILYLTGVYSGPRYRSWIFPDVHRVIARLKTWIRGTHSHVSKKHLNQYLSEFSYRFNRRFKQRRATIFDRLVTACCSTQTITYRQLVADLNG